MNSLRKKIVKATALGLVLAIIHVCMSAELAHAASSNLLANPATQSAQPQGRLTTRGNNPVSVNGSNAKSGETIFSGQSIQTPSGVGATVNLPGLGRVDIAPNTNLTLTFESGKINVALTSGCVILTTDKGVTGTIQSGASSQQTNPTKADAIDVCTSRTPGAPPISGQGAAAGAGAGAAGGVAAGGAAAGAATGGLFGLGVAGTIAFIASAAMITTAAVTGLRPNPSPVR